MKLLKMLGSILLYLTISWSAFAQTGPPPPSNGIWAIIDTNYSVGISTLGFTKARLTLQNTTSTKITGVQFRVFYDKNAFASASVSIVGSNTNLYLQQVDNNASGFITITLVYTGSNSSFTLANGETFEITLNHVTATTFQNLTSISPLSWSGALTFPQVAAQQSGSDIALSLHNYGGLFNLQRLKYKAIFKNITGSNSKNVTVSLERRPKNGLLWSRVTTYTSDTFGVITINEILDTTFYDVRLAVQGDTIGVGNVISVADAQRINQIVIGSVSPNSWDFYSADVNGDGSISISDAYGVFGRIAGRFTTWPNSVKDIKFFTKSEYDTITTNSSVNYSQTIQGVTNFFHNILPGQPDSVIFYVLVPGDANNTGYRMARITPIEIVDPILAPYNVIDESVEYDFLVPTIEVNLPSLSVEEGNLVKLPVKVFTGGNKIGALQLGLRFDGTLLEFKELQNTTKSMNWMSYVNPMNSIIEWGGFDRTNNQNLFNDGETIFTVLFLAKKPQYDWQKSPLYTTRKFVGNDNSGDMSVTPTNGLYQVKMTKGITLKENEILVFPNPTTGEVTIKFNVPVDGPVNLSFSDINGSKVITILDEYMPSGNYSYSADLKELPNGNYFSVLITTSAISVFKTSIQK